MHNNFTVLVIAGNTAVGKTELSLRLASLLNGEVVSADSAQVLINCRDLIMIFLLFSSIRYFVVWTLDLQR